MRFEEVANLQGFVSREVVVGDYVDLLAAWLVHDDVGEERDELRGSMAGSGLAEDLTGFGVERGVQRQRAVSEVLKAVAFGTSGESGNTGSFRSSAWVLPFSDRRRTPPHGPAGSDTVQ